jgi:hypothetical protein
LSLVSLQATKNRRKAVFLMQKKTSTRGSGSGIVLGLVAHTTFEEVAGDCETAVGARYQ